MNAETVALGAYLANTAYDGYVAPVDTFVGLDL